MFYPNAIGFFFVKYFFENIAERLILGGEFNFWQNSKVKPVKKKNFPKNH